MFLKSFNSFSTYKSSTFLLSLLIVLFLVLAMDPASESVDEARRIRLFACLLISATERFPLLNISFPSPPGFTKRVDRLGAAGLGRPTSLGFPAMEPNMMQVSTQHHVAK